MEFDAEMFGAAIGELIRETAKRVEDRVATLEAKVEGMQLKLDKSLAYAGDWQHALDYGPGAVVAHKGAAYVALRAIQAGKADPARDGSGWVAVVKGAAQ